MTVQDDERERELVRMFNLVWDPQHQRGGTDAVLQLIVSGTNYALPVEVKSTTKDSVSTARDVGMDHIRRWREKLFVIGFYARDGRGLNVSRCLCLTPLDMEPWIASVESQIRPDFELGRRASGKLDQQDLFDICGNKPYYTVEDARTIYRRQWTEGEYRANLDINVDGEPEYYSPTMMLNILRRRARYIAERGATLNNPHIPKTHLAKFFGTDREAGPNMWAASVREVATTFITQNPNHPLARPAST